MPGWGANSKQQLVPACPCHHPEHCHRRTDGHCTQHGAGDSRAGLALPRAGMSPGQGGNGQCHPLCHLCPGRRWAVGLFLPGETSAQGIPLGSGIQEGSECRNWDSEWQETRQLLHSHTSLCCLQMEYWQCQQDLICTSSLF